VGKSGAWFDYKDQKVAQGRESAKQYLEDNPKILKEIQDKVAKAAQKD
jgi:recombination protein RecA